VKHQARGGAASPHPGRRSMAATADADAPPRPPEGSVVTEDGQFAAGRGAGDPPDCKGGPDRSGGGCGGRHAPCGGGGAALGNRGSTRRWCGCSGASPPRRAGRPPPAPPPALRDRTRAVCGRPCPCRRRIVRTLRRVTGLVDGGSACATDAWDRCRRHGHGLGVQVKRWAPVGPPPSSRRLPA
jgi:hypothetical protein